MGRLKNITLPLGSTEKRFVLDQTQVDTLIKVYYDDNLVTKNVTGYVRKDSIKNREYYLLTQLGLDVSYDTLVADRWSLSVSRNAMTDGQTAGIVIGGELTLHDVMLDISTVTINSGTVTEAQVRSWLTISDGVLTFDRQGAAADVSAQITLRAKCMWNEQDVKTTVMVVDTFPRTVWVNPDTASSVLEHVGSLALLDDYAQRCKCYVFNSDGTRKSEIASATFVGGYSGMTSGAVTFADGSVRNIADLNEAGCNFMVLRPEFHFFSGLDGNEKEILRGTGIYSAGDDEKVLIRKYIGMFKAYNQNGVLKSQPNRIPTGGQTIATFMQQAVQGGAGHGLWSYNDWKKENILHLLYFANTNYDVNMGAVGRIGGNANASNRIRNIVTGFTLPLVGQYKCGYRPTVDSGGYAVNCLNFFGIEGMGEQIWEFVIGFRHNGTTCFVWDENAWSEIHAGDYTFNLVNNAWSAQYIKKIIAGENFDLLPREVGASGTTGFCDCHWSSSSGRLLRVGGNANAGSFCGLSASSASDAFSDSSAAVGSRLAFIGEPETVDGSELLS